MSNDEVMPQALLLEDEAETRIALRLQLEVMGFNVYDTASPSEAQEIFFQRQFNLVVMHVGHEAIRGLELCRIIRAESNVPILALTLRGEVVNEEMWMGAGADDYVTKPVDNRIFTSRVTQQMKRGESQRIPTAELLTWGPLRMDLNMHEFFVDGQNLKLTNSEFQILQLLMEKPNQVFSREQILATIGTMKGPSASNVIDTHASRIRAKIRKVGGPEVIRVVRSVGFRLSPEPTI